MLNYGQWSSYLAGAKWGNLKDSMNKEIYHRFADQEIRTFVTKIAASLAKEEGVSNTFKMIEKNQPSHDTGRKV